MFESSTVHLHQRWELFAFQRFLFICKRSAAKLPIISRNALASGSFVPISRHALASGFFAFAGNMEGSGPLTATLGFKDGVMSVGSVPADLLSPLY